MTWGLVFEEMRVMAERWRERGGGGMCNNTLLIIISYLYLQIHAQEHKSLPKTIMQL